MILYVYDGNSSLPSLDVKSLQMMAYAKFMKMDIQIIKQTFKPYTGSKLPVFVVENDSIFDLDDFIDYLKIEKTGSNFDLSDPNLAKLDKRYKPYDTLFREKLKPALINLMWCEERNYRQATRSAYSKISRFPFNLIVPNYLRKQAFAYMDSVYPVRNRKEFFSLELVEKAKEVIKLLSDSLTNARYFNGSTPNEIDALIFGYLAVILKTELPILNNLQEFIKEHRNLISYVDRIMNEYFSDHIQMYDQTSEVKDVKENFEVASWKSIVLVGVFAIVTNLFYILYLVPVEEEEEEEESSDEE